MFYWYKGFAVCIFIISLHHVYWFSCGIVNQIANIDSSASSGKQHAILFMFDVGIPDKMAVKIDDSQNGLEIMPVKIITEVYLLLISHAF